MRVLQLLTAMAENGHTTGSLARVAEDGHTTGSLARVAEEGNATGFFARATGLARGVWRSCDRTPDHGRKCVIRHVTAAYRVETVTWWEGGGHDGDADSSGAAVGIFGDDDTCVADNGAGVRVLLLDDDSDTSDAGPRMLIEDVSDDPRMLIEDVSDAGPRMLIDNVSNASGANSDEGVIHNASDAGSDGVLVDSDGVVTPHSTSVAGSDREIIAVNVTSAAPPSNPEPEQLHNDTNTSDGEEADEADDDDVTSGAAKATANATAKATANATERPEEQPSGRIFWPLAVAAVAPVVQAVATPNYFWLTLAAAAVLAGLALAPPALAAPEGGLRPLLDLLRRKLDRAASGPDVPEPAPKQRAARRPVAPPSPGRQAPEASRGRSELRAAPEPAQKPAAAAAPKPAQKPAQPPPQLRRTARTARTARAPRTDRTQDYAKLLARLEESKKSQIS